MVKSLRSRIATVVMQDRRNGSDTVTNYIILKEVLSDKYIKLKILQEYYLNQYPYANND